jgi:hypothetical protein
MGISGMPFLIGSHSRFFGTIVLLSFAVSCCTVAVVIHLDVSRLEEITHIILRIPWN